MNDSVLYVQPVFDLLIDKSIITKSHEKPISKLDMFFCLVLF